VPLPSRCIEVFSAYHDWEQGSSHATPCQWVLRETAGQEGRYIILSHRWDAKTDRAKTTRENYARRLALVDGDAAAEGRVDVDASLDRLLQLFEDTCVRTVYVGA